MSEIPEEVLPTGHQVDVGEGRHLHVHTVGDADGPPVLWLHGSGPGASGWSNFHRNAAFLAERGHASVLPDLLGYGRSSKPTDVGYTFEVLGGTVLRMLDALGHDRVHLVGNSMGGALATWLALEHPDRVDKLVLMAPGGLETRETYMEMRGIRSMMRCLYGPEGLTAAGMHKVFEKQVWNQDIVPRDTIDERFLVAKTQPLHVFKSLRVPNLSERLGEVTAPTLCLWGTDDLFCPPSGAQTVLHGIPQVRVVMLNRCGHWVMVEHRDVFDRYLLDFLDHG